MPDTTTLDERPVDTVAASKLLAELGYPYAVKSLDRMRSAGGGPKFLKHGARVFYQPSALRAWVVSKTREMAHTGDARAAASPNEERHREAVPDAVQNFD